MAQIRPVSSKNIKKFITTAYRKYANLVFLNKLIFDPKYLRPVSWLLLIAEVFLNVFIIQRVNYTEIDWRAYMQECEGFLNGTLDYTQLKGDTGPLVYPAGFVYIYSILYYITSYGANIRLGQYIFLCLYLAQLYFTFKIYIKTQKVPPFALALITLTSYRIHSIYVLRLFNDPVAVLLFYISLNYFITSQWTLGSIFYSLAVSVKMNILLYAPCLLLVYLTNVGLVNTVYYLAICATIQVALGLPFLYGNFWGYIMGSFDLGRIFEHKWTVNYRFLERDAFENKYFHVGLLLLHLLLLGLYFPMIKKYLTSYANLSIVIEQVKPQIHAKKAQEHLKTSGQPRGAAKRRNKSEHLTKEQHTFLDTYEKQLKKQNPEQEKPTVEEEYNVNFDQKCQLLVLPFFVTNLIGIACARSLHYQFYSWYFHSLLYLVFSTGYRKSVMFLMLAVIEFCWNTYPSTNFSSISLHVCHALLLIGVYRCMKN